MRLSAKAHFAPGGEAFHAGPSFLAPAQLSPSPVEAVGDSWDTSGGAPKTIDRAQEPCSGYSLMKFDSPGSGFMH